MQGLARGQERELRSWLYAPARSAAGDRLRIALESVAADVEEPVRRHGADLQSAGRGHRDRAQAAEGDTMTANRPRVVIVYDHRLFRAGVRAELGEAVDVVGEAADVESAVALV